MARSSFERALIVVEGLCSMDGDYPDLPRLIEIKSRHNAWLILDEAHALGVLGQRGYGTAEHFGIDPRPSRHLDGYAVKNACWLRRLHCRLPRIG